MKTFNTFSLLFLFYLFWIIITGSLERTALYKNHLDSRLLQKWQLTRLLFCAESYYWLFGKKKKLSFPVWDFFPPFNKKSESFLFVLLAWFVLSVVLNMSFISMIMFGSSCRNLHYLSDNLFSGYSCPLFFCNPTFCGQKASKKCSFHSIFCILKFAFHWRFRDKKNQKISSEGSGAKRATFLSAFCKNDEIAFF